MSGAAGATGGSPEELIRVSALLEFGLDDAQRLTVATWTDPRDAPRLYVARHADGFVIYPSAGLDLEVGRRLARTDPERLYSGEEVDRVLAAARPLERIELEHGEFAPTAGSAPSPEVARHGNHFIDLRDGRPVSWAWTAREHAKAASVAVETVPEYRRQGRGTRVLSAWVVAVRARRKLPLEAHAVDDVAAGALARAGGATPFARSVRYL